ncbi:hypothetical protein [Streptomyces sp. NRRL B-3648]|uniref:hypothetical protein n=1 Tax=Streptomyces sp. NRRL B-3648 TaxID=1519493 RepID=UPI00131D4BB5|nr:hypothetical protein [Streptomyces sp. NRRL B-3648]
MSVLVVAGVIVFLAVMVGLARRRRGPVPHQRVVHRTITPDGPVENFNPMAAPTHERVTARAEAFVVMFVRADLAGPGIAWFEPNSPLVFERDTGDVHVIPRRLIEAVRPYDGDEPQTPDEQTLVIDLRPGAGISGIAVFAGPAALSEWRALAAGSA